MMFDDFQYAILSISSLSVNIDMWNLLEAIQFTQAPLPRFSIFPCDILAAKIDLTI
jgi:hypothetical protein